MFAVINYIGNIDRFSPSSSFLSFFLTLFCVFYVHQIINIIVSLDSTPPLLSQLCTRKLSSNIEERILCWLRIVKTNTIRIYVIHISILNIELLKHTRQICTKIGNYLDYYPQSINKLLHNSLLHRVFNFLLVTIFNFYKILMSNFFFYYAKI